MNQSVRKGAILFAGYFALLALEALWIAVGSRWFQSAQEWSLMHPPHTPAWGVVVFTIGFTVAWAADQGYRWAWRVAVIWAGIISASSFVLLALAGLEPRGGLLGTLVYAHPVETTAGLFQMACGLGSLCYLCRKDARDWVFRSGQPKTPGRVIPQ